MLTALLLSLALSADIPANMADISPVTTQEQRDLLTTMVAAHFPGVNLSAAQRLHCTRGDLDTCILEELGTCTRKQYADAKAAGVNNIRPISVVGDVVTYRRLWRKELVEGKAVHVEVTEGARRDALVAYLQALHPDVTLAFLAAVVVNRVGAGITSKAVYLSVIDDLDTAQLELEGKLHGLAPE